MRTILKFSFLLLFALCGCKTVDKDDWRPRASIAAEDSAMVTPGPPGVMSCDGSSCLVLVDNSTNRRVLVKIKDNLGNWVGRFVMDKDVYGESVMIDPGWLPMGEAPDRPRGHLIYTQKRIPMGAK